MFLPERKRANVMSAATADRATTTAWVETAALILLLAVPLAAYGGGASSALRDYNAGNFTNALAEYQQLAKVDTNDLRLLFNAGTAAYQATNYNEALKYFEIVTAAQDLKLQQKAYYDLGNTQYRIGQAGKDLDEVQNLWEAAVKGVTSSRIRSTPMMGRCRRQSGFFKKLPLRRSSSFANWRGAPRRRLMRPRAGGSITARWKSCRICCRKILPRNNFKITQKN